MLAAKKLPMAMAGAAFIALNSVDATPVSAAVLSQVDFSGTVTEVFNLPQVQVGNALTGSFTYDPTQVIGTVNPGPEGGPFPYYPIITFELTVGNLAGTLNPSIPFSFFIPELLNTGFNTAGAFFNDSEESLFAFNGGGEIFSIVREDGGSIVGTYRASIVQPPTSVPEPNFSSVLLGLGILTLLRKALYQCGEKVTKLS